MEDSSIALNALVRKRAEIAGLIEAAEQRIAELQADLVHLDATLRLMGYRADPLCIRARRPAPVRVFRRHEIASFAFRELRAAGSDGLDTIQLTDALARKKAFDTADARFMRALAATVGKSLDTQRRIGNLVRERRGKLNVWRLVSAAGSPEQ